ncbi:MAG: hypothetical protein LBU34_15995 [Planctomycetaceae bacterium]|jgi:hypothetical protein|nr:hypothetical protein [Planctomycetaceae bacterium]
MNLWNNETEKQFFMDAIGRFATPEKLFYSLEAGKFVYVPKGYGTEGQILQARNALIGSFTETWVKNLLEPIARKLKLFAVNTVECPNIGLHKRSEADLAFCTTDSKLQCAQNVKLIFEIKMSIVSNYKYTVRNSVDFIGDYKTHKGTPSLLRSDAMLKAIGKSINIRVSGIESTKIPIIVLGNSPITKNYSHKVDFLKSTGVIQGFWSLNPAPTQTDFVKETEKYGFQTIHDVHKMETLIKDLLCTKLNYFSSMVSQKKLGENIRIASNELTDEAKAEKFLSLIRGI